MRTDEDAERLGSERTDWEIECDLRWKAARASASARKKFDRWLEGFKPKSKRAGRVPKTGFEQVNRTNMFLTMALLFSAVWALAVVRSLPSVGFSIHLLLAPALVLFAIVWVRRVHYRTPI